MIWKNKALAVALLWLVVVGAPVGCSSQIGEKPKPVAEKPKQQAVNPSEAWGKEEELTEEEDPDRDEFGRPKEDQPGFWMSVGYLGMTVVGSLLPFLMLL